MHSRFEADVAPSTSRSSARIRRSSVRKRPRRMRPTASGASSHTSFTCGDPSAVALTLQEIRIPLNLCGLAWQHLSSSHNLSDLLPDSKIEMDALDGSLTMACRPLTTTPLTAQMSQVLTDVVRGRYALARAHGTARSE